MRAPQEAKVAEMVISQMTVRYLIRIRQPGLMLREVPLPVMAALTAQLTVTEQIVLTPQGPDRVIRIRLD
jgi:hypothetical protein